MSHSHWMEMCQIEQLITVKKYGFAGKCQGLYGWDVMGDDKVTRVSHDLDGVSLRFLLFPSQLRHAKTMISSSNYSTFQYIDINRPWIHLPMLIKVNINLAKYGEPPCMYLVCILGKAHLLRETAVSGAQGNRSPPPRYVQGLQFQ